VQYECVVVDPVFCLVCLEQCSFRNTQCVCIVALRECSSLLECSPSAASAAGDMEKLVRPHGMEGVFQVKFDRQGW